MNSLSAIKKYIIRNKWLVFFSLINIVAFILTRWGYFETCYLPGYTRDSSGYYKPVADLLNGGLPVFDIRTLGYPLYLFVVGIFTNTLKGVFVGQALITLLVSSMLIKQHIKQPLLVFILIMFFNSGNIINFETTLSPISLFVSFLVLFYILIYKYLTKPNGSITLFLIALCSFYIVMLRPQGMITLPVIMLFVIYTIFYKKEFKPTFIITISSVILYGLVALYNYNTAGFFNALPTKFSLVASLGTNIFNLHSPVGINSEVNKEVETVKNSFTKAEVEIIEKSWNYNKLKQVFTIANYDKCWQFYNLVGNNPSDIKELINTSAKQGYITRFKFAYFSVISYFDLAQNNSLFYINTFNNRSYYLADSTESNAILNHRYFLVITKEWATTLNPNLPSNQREVIWTELNENHKNQTQSTIYKLLCLWDLITHKILYNMAWVVLLLISIVIHIYTTIKNNHLFTTKGLTALVLLLLILSNIAVLGLTIFPIMSYVLPTLVFHYIYIFVVLTPQSSILYERK